MRASTIVALAALGAAFVLLARRANAYALANPYDAAPEFSTAEGDFVGPLYDDAGYEGYTMIDDDTALADPRVRAMLQTIGTLEHTPQAVANGAAYFTFYGGSRFSGFANHPVLTGEKKGVPLPAAMCIAAGYADGVCVSTAAGKYQFIVPTWNDVRGQTPRLPDFSPESQDRAAVRLLRKTGALQSLFNDDIDGALRLASSRWASLPYATVQQNPKSLAYALSVYQQHLET